MHTVKLNIHPLLKELELRNNKRYFWTEIGTNLDMTGTAAKSLVMQQDNEDGYIRYSTIAKLLDFFHAEGMPVTIDQLFTVTPVTPD